MGFCLSLVDMLVDLLVALFVGFGCCVALWLLAYMWGPVSGCCPFPRFLGEVLSVLLFLSRLAFWLGVLFVWGIALFW